MTLILHRAKVQVSGSRGVHAAGLTKLTHWQLMQHPTYLMADRWAVSVDVKHHV